MEQFNRQIFDRAARCLLIGVGATTVARGVRWVDHVWPNRSNALVRLARSRLIRRQARHRLLLSALIAVVLALGPKDSLATNDSGQGMPPAQGRHEQSIAFHYGHDAPLDVLRAFDIIVVEPGHDHDPPRHVRLSGGKSALYAYISIGEVRPDRAYQAAMPADMMAGKNTVWATRIIDQSHPDWPAFFAEKVVAPLWRAGYRGFFLDTMDAYHNLVTDSAGLKAQQDGLIRTIEALKQRYPEAQLITNRGFELLPRLSHLVNAVAAESLFGRWDQDLGLYVEVPPADREWLLARLREVQALGLQAISIDYANPGDRAKTRALADKIRELDITPYVTSGDIASTGVGLLEVMPRRVLLIHNSTPENNIEQASTAHLRAMMPLQYLGFRVDMLDLDRYALPDVSLADRYAGIVGFFEKDDPALEQELTRFLSRAVDEQVPVALLNTLGVPVVSPLAQRLGLLPMPRRPRAPVKVSYQSADGVGDEIEPLPRVDGLAIRAPAGSTALLKLQDATEQIFDGVAITPWGGYAVRPYTYVSVESGVDRWVIDPVKFLEKTIVRNQFLPIPDVTTENGRRLLLVHIDGDGFASRAEIPGTPFAAEVMYREFIKRYEVPHTVSVIEGETGPQGMYPELSPQLENIARRIFRLDHVELASHSYSHPFFWHSVVANAEQGNPSNQAESLQHLPIEGYNFDLHRDIVGSVDYINNRLAPEGKKVGVFLWTGDSAPPPQALKKTYEAGLLNMNAGDTTMTRRHPTLSMVVPMSIRKDGWLQVMAPNQNENVYTNDWTGPFYGFQRVIETFEMTNFPRRIKPINIYYHTYSASKHSSITALHQVYRYALRQAVNPIYGSEYIRKVQDFESFSIARELGADPGRQIWRLTSGGDLRTVRIPNAMANKINWRLSEGLAGKKQGVDGTYLHLAGVRARITFDNKNQALAPHVVAANGRIENFRRLENGFEFEFSAHVTGRLTLAHAKQCVVLGAKRQLKLMRPASRRVGHSSNLYTNDYQIHANHARSGLLVSVRC